MDKIIDSFNIYTCSDRGEENPSSTGDVFELNMNNSKIDIQKGQFFRLSLVNFNMFKPFTNINSANDRFGSQHGNEYFMNLHNLRHLTNIKFYLTNSHGLPLSEITTNNQEPKIDFTMVLKVDIVEKNAPNERHTADPRRGINPKLSNQIVTEGGLTRDY